MSVWHEIRVVGAEKALRGFVAGFLAARGAHEPVLFAHDVGVGRETLTERVHDLLAPAHLDLLAPQNVADPLVAALRDRGGEVDLQLERRAVVSSAALPFAAEVFSEDSAARVKEVLLAELPPGVALELSVASEERDREAKGAELYTPEHAFIYRTSGRLIGPLPGVLEMRRRAGDLEFVRVEGIVLETSDLPLVPGR